MFFVARGFGLLHAFFASQAFWHFSVVACVTITAHKIASTIPAAKILLYIYILLLFEQLIGLARLHKVLMISGIGNG